MHSSIILTNLDCNLRCSYCYEHNKCNRVVDLEKVKEFVNYMFKKCYNESKENGRIKFHLIGGEPFLHPEVVETVCKLAKDKYKEYNFKKLPLIYISTNGTLIDQPKIIDTILYPYKDILDLGFSIDGNKDTHDAFRKTIDGRGTYDKSIQNLKLALDILGPDHAGCKCTYNHNTINDWYNGVKNLVDIGVRTINANFVTEEEWPEEETELLFNQFSKMVDYIFDMDLYDQVYIKQCSFGHIQQAVNFSPEKIHSNQYRTCHTIKNNLCLGVDGLLYPCHRFAALPDQSFSIGKMIDGEAVITNQPLRDKIYEFLSPGTLSEKCRNCNLKYLCYTCSEYYFEQNSDNPIDARNKQKSPLCAWTIAVTAARLYFKRRLRALVGIDPDYEGDIVLTRHELKEGDNKDETDLSLL